MVDQNSSKANPLRHFFEFRQTAVFSLGQPGCRSYLLVKLSQSQHIAFAICKPGPLALPKRGHTVDGLHFRRVVLFKDYSPGFEVGHCGLDISRVPGHLGMGSAGSSSRGKDQKPGPSTTTVEEA